MRGEKRHKLREGEWEGGRVGGGRERGRREGEREEGGRESAHAEARGYPVKALYPSPLYSFSDRVSH
jgi:hypothetical protein